MSETATAAASSRPVAAPEGEDPLAGVGGIERHIREIETDIARSIVSDPIVGHVWDAAAPIGEPKNDAELIRVAGAILGRRIAEGSL